MTSADDAIKPSPPPRWIAPWLALLAPLYVISPLALLGLPYLKRLPKTALWVLGFYALSQQIPALFTPEPLLASVLALVRTLLMFGLMGVGVALGDAQRLKPFAIGLAIVYITAMIYSAVGGLDIFSSRLTHPYMTPITLGLAGALGLWLACFLPGNITWRVFLGTLSVAGLLLSGSRGPLAAALIGCLVGMIGGYSRRNPRLIAALLIAGAAIFGAFFAGERLDLSFMTRLTSADTTGRDVVWANTLSVIQAHPWSGVGSYRLGDHLAPPGDPCTFFTRADGSVPTCPAFLKNMGSPWLIAHNATLQQLAETGPLGFLGFMTLLGSVVFSVFRHRDALSLAVVTGLLVSTINDNTLLIPSPFFAEVFWMVAGLNLLRLPPLNWQAGLMAAGTALLLATPLLGAFAAARHSQPRLTPTLRFFQAGAVVASPQDYTVRFMVDLPPGTYRAVLKTCLETCTTLNNLSFWQSNQSALLTLKGDLRPMSEQQLKLQILPGISSFDLRPAAERIWKVQVKP